MTLAKRTSAASLLSAELGRAITPAYPARPSVGALVGVEHEFRVLLHGRPIDFRQVIHRLPIDGRRIDPLDPDAYRCAWGGTITADGPEAEIAIAPVSVGRDVAARTLARTTRGRFELEGVLPAGAALEGYSTHISVEVPDTLVDRAADRFVRHFSAAMTLMLDEPNSPGLLVRPRPGRLELGGEFADGDRLAVATVFAIGAVRASLRATRRGPLSSRRLPPMLAVEPEPAVERYGWFVGDSQLGVPLHLDGRATVLSLRDGRTMPAQRHLEAAWRAARRELSDLSTADLAAVDAVVAGRSAAWAGSAPANQDAATSPDPWSAAMRRRDRPGFVVDPVVLSWDFAVFRVSDGSRSAYACLPRDVLGGALDALDAGQLDHLFRAYLATDEPSPRILASSAQTSAAGLYRGIGRVADLAGVERGPAGGGRNKRQRQDDRDKRDDRDHRSDDQAASRRPDPSRVAKSAPGAGAAAALTIIGFPAAVVAAAVGVVGVAIVGGALVLGGGGSGSAGSPGASQPGPSLTAVASASFSAPSEAAGVSDPICDTWLTQAAIESTLGAPPVSIALTVGEAPATLAEADPFAAPWPVNCLWTTASGDTITMNELTLAATLASQPPSPDNVSGVGRQAVYLPAYHALSSVWGEDQAVSVVALKGTRGGQPVGKDTLTSLARQITVPGAALTPTSAPSAAPSSAGALDSPICDPWLTGTQVAAMVGKPPVEIQSRNFLNDGQPVDCKWVFADGSNVQLVALEQPQYGQLSDYPVVDGVRYPEGLDYVDGLGLVAEYRTDANFNTLEWFPDDRIILQFDALRGHGQELTREQLISLAHLAQIPSPLPVAP